MRKKEFCTVDECDNTNIACKGLCWKHYRRMLRHDTTDNPDYINSGKICHIEGCESPARLTGLCIKHSSRVHRNGDAFLMKRNQNYTEEDICLVHNCSEHPRSAGLCCNHYANFRYHVRKGNIDNLSVYLEKVREGTVSG